MVDSCVLDCSTLGVSALVDAWGAESFVVSTGWSVAIFWGSVLLTGSDGSTVMTVSLAEGRESFPGVK